MTPSEEWRPVVGYEGYYEVSELGQVRSLDRLMPHPLNPGGVRRKRGRLLKATWVRHYATVTLAREGAKRGRTVHSLVAEAFLGPRVEGMVVCHDNGDPADNRRDNLRYDTQLGNIHDKHKHGTAYPRRNATECPHGHSWTEPNSVYIYGDGAKQCATCARAKQRRYHAKKRAERLARNA